MWLKSTMGNKARDANTLSFSESTQPAHPPQQHCACPSKNTTWRASDTALQPLPIPTALALILNTTACRCCCWCAVILWWCCCCSCGTCTGLADTHTYQRNSCFLLRLCVGEGWGDSASYQHLAIPAVLSTLKKPWTTQHLCQLEYTVVHGRLGQVPHHTYCLTSSTRALNQRA